MLELREWATKIQVIRFIIENKFVGKLSMYEFCFILLS